MFHQSGSGPRTASAHLRLGMAGAGCSLDYFRHGHLSVDHRLPCPDPVHHSPRKNCVCDGHDALCAPTFRLLVFFSAVLVRILWMFIGNRWSRWDQFIPTTKKRFKDFLETGRCCGYMDWAPPSHVGHNAIAGFSYAAVYGMAIVEIITGFALFSSVLGSRTFRFFVG